MEPNSYVTEEEANAYEVRSGRWRQLCPLEAAWLHMIDFPKVEKTWVALTHIYSDEDGRIWIHNNDLN